MKSTIAFAALALNLCITAEARHLAQANSTRAGGSGEQCGVDLTVQGSSSNQSTDICIILLSSVSEKDCEALAKKQRLHLLSDPEDNICIWPVPAPCSALSSDSDPLQECPSSTENQIQTVAETGEFNKALTDNAEALTNPSPSSSSGGSTSGPSTQSGGGGGLLTGSDNGSSTTGR